MALMCTLQLYNTIIIIHFIDAEKSVFIRPKVQGNTMSYAHKIWKWYTYY